MNISGRRFATFLVLAVAIVAFALPAWPASTAKPRQGSTRLARDGRIAFHSFQVTLQNPTGDYEIFTMADNGGDVQQLTNNTNDDRIPVWSPDGAKIAFCQDGGIAIMDSDGKHQTRITNGPGDADPSWSPDSAKIAFSRQAVLGGPTELWVMDATGANQRKLDIGGASNARPDWSPDGQLIAFDSDRLGSERTIFTVRPDGSDVQEVGPGVAPNWSPNGDRIAFNKQVEVQNDIFVMDADGSDATNLTNRADNEYAPDWSPSGNWITYVTNVGGLGEIYTMRADGSERFNLTSDPSVIDDEPSWQPIPIPPPKLPMLDIPKLKRGDIFVFGSSRVTPENPEGDEELFTSEAQRFRTVVRQLTANSGVEDSFAEWSPDGSKLVFLRDREIFTMHADGTHVVQITTNGASDEDLAPSWSPDGNRIVFSSDRGSALNQLYIVDADGQNLVKLTDSPRLDSTPDWSPDGSRIVFTRIMPDGSGSSFFCIFTINPDGTGLTQLTFPGQGNNTEPSWSPDGQRIAFVRNVVELSTMAADGSDQRQVISGQSVFEPRWSRDGRFLIYEDQGEIYSVKTNGASRTNRTNDPGLDRAPDWSPNPANSVATPAASSGESGTEREKQRSRKKDHQREKKRDKHEKRGKHGKHGNNQRHKANRDGGKHRHRGD